MAQKKSPQDDILIQNLYEKLNWFTFEATKEEFDTEQVRAILALLDSLDPIEDAPELSDDGGAPAVGDLAGAVSGKVDAGIDFSDPDAAFERFKQKFNISEEELVAKDGRNAAASASNRNSGLSHNGKIVSFPKGGTEEFAEELSFDAERVEELLASVNEMKEDSRVAGETEDFVEAGLVGNGVAGGSGAAGKKAKKRKRFVSTAWGKAVAGIAVVVLATLCLEVSTSALHERSFFEVVRDGVNGMKITVTGNEVESETDAPVIGMESEERIYYDSWDEVKEEEPDILVPGYMPEGLELVELYREDVGERRKYRGIYEDNVQHEAKIRIDCFDNVYKKIGFGSDEKLRILEEENGVSYYQSEVNNLYYAIWKNGKSIYGVSWKNLDEVKEIVCEMCN